MIELMSDFRHLRSDLREIKDENSKAHENFYQRLMQVEKGLITKVELIDHDKLKQDMVMKKDVGIIAGLVAFLFGVVEFIFHILKPAIK